MSSESAQWYWDFVIKLSARLCSSRKRLIANRALTLALLVARI
jgi:hypothetical protein